MVTKEQIAQAKEDAKAAAKHTRALESVLSDLQHEYAKEQIPARGIVPMKTVVSVKVRRGRYGPLETTNGIIQEIPRYGSVWRFLPLTKTGKVSSRESYSVDPDDSTLVVIGAPDEQNDEEAKKAAKIEALRKQLEKLEGGK